MVLYTHGLKQTNKKSDFVQAGQAPGDKANLMKSIITIFFTFYQAFLDKHREEIVKREKLSNT